MNDNKLTKSVPEFILLDENSEQLKLFVNMLGQHYDILYTYIDAMTRINKRDEHPKLGMPNELLYSVAKQFGWNLIDGNQNKNLWEYALGTNENGIPLTGSNSVGDPSVPSKDITYNTWRRIVNNIPGLLKAKGTKRSIQALLACYGVPQSLITIKEYGGPRLNRIPQYNKLNFDYSLDLIRNPAGTVTTNYDQVIKSSELRFRLDNVISNPTMSSDMNLYKIGPSGTSVNIDFTAGTKGTFTIKSPTDTATSGEMELFDGGYINTLLKTGSNDAGDGTLTFIAKRAVDGKIISTVSASVSGSFGSSGTAIFGDTETGYVRLQGQLQEFRLWSSSLHHTNQIGDLDNPFTNHTKAPAAYDGNTSAYDELIYRLPLTERIDHSATGSLIGVQPVANGISSSFASWTNDIPYDSIEETYYYDGISIGAGTFDDNKVRIEDNKLIGNLDFSTRAERSQFDKAALDIKKLGVYFSPQTMINEDIIAQLGFTMLDDYIGDPGDLNSKSYPDLKHRAIDYWKKYNQKNDLNAYIKIFSLFDLGFFKQLDQLLPARADKLTGLLIQPNLLERNKDSVLPTVGKSLVSYNKEIRISLISTSSNDTFLADIPTTRIYSASAADDDQLTAMLTSSKSYEPTPYYFQELIRSGSTWKQVTSSYWTGEATLPAITGSRLSEFSKTIYSSSAGFTLRTADTQDFLPTAVANHEFNGCKMTSPDFNIDSLDTVDGGPVVEIIEANPNQVIVNSGPSSTNISPNVGGTSNNLTPNTQLGRETTTRSRNRNSGGNEESKGGNLTYR